MQHLLAGDDGDGVPAGPVIPAVADLMIDDETAGDPYGHDDEAMDGAEGAGDEGGVGAGDAGASLAGLAVALPVALPDNADFAEANKQIRAVGAAWVLQGVSSPRLDPHQSDHGAFYDSSAQAADPGFQALGR